MAKETTMTILVKPLSEQTDTEEIHDALSLTCWFGTNTRLLMIKDEEVRTLALKFINSIARHKSTPDTVTNAILRCFETQ